MIEYSKGNMFESDADCLLNTVNCEGFMGKGIAYQFKLKFPENNKSYIKACKSGELTVGKIHYYVEDDITIINFPTKDKWREDSKIEYIKDGLDYFIQILPTLNVKKIAIPPLGCGNGGLAWDDVKTIIEEKISAVADKYNFIIYEPSISYKAIPKKPPQINVSALVLLDIRMNLKRFNSIRLQKTGYLLNLFMEEEYFKFDKWKYGPYSHSIDIVANKIKEYQEYYALDNSNVTFEHLYQIICSKKVDAKFSQLHVAVEKATDYVNEIKSDKMLEGITTILYLIQNEMPHNKEQLIDSFNNWSQDKAARFSDEYIASCIGYLEDTAIISLDICGNYELTSNAL